MSDDWENEFDNAPVVPVVVPSKKKWEDEDVEDNVKESWEDLGDDEEKKTKKKDLEPIRPKAPLAQRKAEEKKKQEAKLASSEADDPNEDAIARKDRLRNLELAADIKNAQDLFADIAVKDNEPLETLKPKTKTDDPNEDAIAREDLRKLELAADTKNAQNLLAGVAVKENEPLETLKPKTKEDFDKFQQRLVDLIQAHQKQGLYVAFIESLTRELCVPFRDVDLRKVSSTLTALANEKQKQQREAAKPKKKAVKPSLAKEVAKTSSKVVDDYAGTYDDDFDDIDDFM